MRKALAAAALAVLVLAGCGDSEEAQEPTAATTDAGSPTADTGEPTGDPGGQETADGATGGDQDADDDSAHVEIEIEGDSVHPRGARVTAEVGEPLRLAVESDRPGELHVHSSPEQLLEFGEGEQVLELVIERPGVIEVEEHESGVVILQLEVR